MESDAVVYWFLLIFASCSFISLMLAVISKYYFKPYFPLLIDISICLSMITSQIQVISLSSIKLFKGNKK